MKRFIEIALLVLALVMGAYLVFYRSSVPVDTHRGEELAVPYRVKGTMIERARDDGYDEVRLRGVELSSALPGKQFSDYAASTEDYARWLDQIGELGANTVVVTQLMDDEFYDALLAYNEAHDDPLLLVQGIMVESDYEKSSANAYDSGLLEQLTKQGKVVVDAIHGHRDVSSSGIGGSGTFRSDVSQWVVALLVVEEFDVDNVAYTDRSTTHDGSFEGTYFETTDDATAFEAMLASVMEDVTAYETKKYDMQRPIGFTSSPDTDPLEYEATYARQLNKYASVDPEHVVPTKKDVAGRICAYRITDIADGYASYLSTACSERFDALLKGLDADAPHGGYLQFLRAYHTMPTIGFFSASSARATSYGDATPLTEREQGEALCEISDALEQAGWQGSIISSWQDVWQRRSWNTAFATYETNAYMWHDLQTPTQSEGLLAFDPGQEAACVLDGVADEWGPDDVVVPTNDGLRLSARYDAEGLYLLAEGIGADDVAYIPLDVSREVGVTSCADPALAFGNNVEFVLCIDGEQNTRLLVQDHYNPTREMFQYEIDGTDPFVDPIAADDTTFSVATIAQSNSTLLSEQDYSAKKRTYLAVENTGMLVHGNGDPTSDEYNSLADFCFGEDCVEVRLPWLLINVGDPSHMLAHRDYYDHYGVEFKKTKKIGMSICVEIPDDPMIMHSLSVHGWKSVKYRERLKQSYDVVQAAWGGGE